MRDLIYSDDGIVLLKDGAKYFVRYDAGSHQVAIREDEISAEEAKQVVAGFNEATQVLFAIQKRLVEMGVDPYVSNT